MNVRFNRQEMADALSVVCSVAASRTPKVSLQCVRIEAHPDFLLLSATDLEIGLRSAVSQVEVSDGGETLVLADTLSRIVHECSDEILVIEDEGNILHVRGADSHFQIVTQDVSDFPPIPTIEGEPDFTVGYAPICRLIEWTKFAAARESTRYAINGVLWEVKGEKLTLAATDGRRLSCGHGEIKAGESEVKFEAIVPTKTLQLLGQIQADADASVGVKYTGNQILFHVGPTSISSSLVEGRFPKYEDVIPSDCEQVVEFNTLELQSALKRAALLTNEESKGVRLAFEEGLLTLSSRAPEQGEATISLSIDFKGPPTEIGFNPVFLLDALRAAHCDTVKFSFKDSGRPGVIATQDDLVCVVMPVSLS